MQEKVSFTPPEIKIFEGKTPPTSWFNENVVRYFQIKGQTDFLHTFVTYLHQLQSEKIAKAIPQAVKAEPEYASIPEEANTEQVSNALTYNALQPNIKTEIEFMEKLIIVLQKANPNLVKELDQDLTLLKLMAKGFPALNKQNLDLLKKMMNKMDDYASKLPPSSQRKYLESQFNMLYQIWENIDKSLKSSQAEKEKISKKAESLEQLVKGLNTLNALLSQKGGKNFTSGEIQHILSFLQAAADTHSTLSSKEQAVLKGYLEKLGMIKGQNGTSLANIASDALLKKWIQEFLSANPGASSIQLKAYIKNLLDESHLQSTDLPFLSDMGSSLNELVENQGFPFSSGNSETVFALDQKGKIHINPHFDKELERSYTLDAASAKETISAKQHVETALKEWALGYRTRQQGYESSAQARQEIRDAVGATAANTAGKSFGSGSLPNEFKNAILGHYMPAQEKYLMQLAELLYFANFGAEMGNALLNKIMDFGEAANNYDFGNFLHKDGNQYSGSYTQAKAQLSNEKRQLAEDQNKIKSTLNYIQSEIAKINSNTQLSPAQKKTLIDNLQKYANDLTTAESQLSSLSNILNGLTVTKGSDANHFNVTGNVSGLSQAESVVINGDPGGKPPGGLINIQSEIQADQQSFSDQGQNQQMILQMRMTEIQQEWTVVSDSLQALNQMYMTCAQSIYK